VDNTATVEDVHRCIEKCQVQKTIIFSLNIFIMLRDPKFMLYGSGSYSRGPVSVPCFTLVLKETSDFSVTKNIQEAQRHFDTIVMTTYYSQKLAAFQLF
jgi:hypothetical protein